MSHFLAATASALNEALERALECNSKDMDEEGQQQDVEWEQSELSCVFLSL